MTRISVNIPEFKFEPFLLQEKKYAAIKQMLSRDPSIRLKDKKIDSEDVVEGVLNTLQGVFLLPIGFYTGIKYIIFKKKKMAFLKNLTKDIYFSKNYSEYIHQQFERYPNLKHEYHNYIRYYRDNDDFFAPDRYF